MGRLSNQVLGDASGKVGHMVFRVRKGTNIISKVPAKRTSVPTEKELAIREKFGLTGKVARGIYSIPQLREVWPKLSGKLTVCNEIFQVNYPLLNTLADLGTVSVAPIYGFNALNPVVTVGANSVQLATNALGVGVGINTAIEKYMIVCGVAILQDPTMASWPKSEVVSFKSIQQNLDLINPIDVTAQLAGGDLTKFVGYATRAAFVCIITLDDNGKAIRYSQTFQSA
jgi:hypothetical protein